MEMCNHGTVRVEDQGRLVLSDKAKAKNVAVETLGEIGVMGSNEIDDGIRIEHGRSPMFGRLRELGVSASVLCEALVTHHCHEPEIHMKLVMTVK
jgi:hypothetical protein